MIDNWEAKAKIYRGALLKIMSRRMERAGKDGQMLIAPMVLTAEECGKVALQALGEAQAVPPIQPEPPASG